MNQEILLRKLKAEYDYLKAEYEYQNELFKKARTEFDKRFENKLNLQTQKNKKTNKEKKSDKRTKSLDKVYKKLAQKIHPGHTSGHEDDSSLRSKERAGYAFARVWSPPTAR